MSDNDMSFFTGSLGSEYVSGIRTLSQRVLAIFCTDSSDPLRYGSGTIFPSMVRNNISGYGDNDLRGFVEIAVDSAVSQYNQGKASEEPSIVAWTVDNIERDLDSMRLTWTLTTADGTEETTTETLNLQ